MVVVGLRAESPLAERAGGALDRRGQQVGLAETATSLVGLVRRIWPVAMASLAIGVGVHARGERAHWTGNRWASWQCAHRDVFGRLLVRWLGSGNGFLVQSLVAFAAAVVECEAVVRGCFEEIGRGRSGVCVGFAADTCSDE